MRVYIGNYRNHWISPYTVLERVLWWKDWDKIEYSTPWVERWSNRLNPICTALQKFLDVVHPKIDYVKIQYSDTWSMDSTLAMIVLPMLKQLKATKHGSPLVADADVPDGLELRSTEALPKENEWDSDSNIHERWEWVINEMIFAFECKNNDSWDEQFWVRKPKSTLADEIENLNKPGRVDEMCDREGRTKMQERISNGFRLFGIYYESLWD